MKSNRIMFALVIIVVFSIIGAGLSILFTKFIELPTTNSFETDVSKTKTIDTVSYNPPMPLDAPENIKDAVVLGWKKRSKNPVIGGAN